MRCSRLQMHWVMLRICLVLLAGGWVYIITYRSWSSVAMHFKFFFWVLSDELYFNFHAIVECHFPLSGYLKIVTEVFGFWEAYDLKGIVFEFSSYGHDSGVTMKCLCMLCSQVLMLIDASFGFEMETFEFLNICQVHGFPKIMGILTHLDTFKNNKQLKKTKKRLKHRFWTEVYPVWHPTSIFCMFLHCSS